MKPLLITGLLVLAMLGLTACSSGSGTDRPQPGQTTQIAEAAGNMEREEAASQEQTEYISAVPKEYFAPSGHPGQVVEITYDSRDYTDPAEPAIQKTAYVYLPYGYDDTDQEARYDVLYLMHGWTMTAGDFFDPAQSGIVSMLDHMVENGDIPPVIAVYRAVRGDGRGAAHLLLCGHQRRHRSLPRHGGAGAAHPREWD